MYPASFRYHRPSGLHHALELLSRHKADAAIIAGGQSLVPRMNLRQATPKNIVDLNRIADLSKLAVVNDVLEIGAMVRHQSFCCEAAIGHLSLPSGFAELLGRMAGAIGNLPVRLRGTIGGSLANASPKAQWALLSFLLDADIVVENAEGMRCERCIQFVKGDGRTTLKPDDIITSVRIKVPPEDWRYGFAQLAPQPSRPASAFALAAITLEDARVRDCRIAIGACTPVPCRLHALEDWLSGRRASASGSDDLVEIAAAAVRQQGGENQPYIEHLAVVATTRAIAQALEC
ncbi:FAD binding domain-containing protein [Neorhizobium sp. IRAMC:178]|uniref:FAD binding domain-containing protein n=1 Tax=Neorhizobium tunisiense TaxID=3144793 RepID=UPI0031F62763